MSSNFFFALNKTNDILSMDEQTSHASSLDLSHHIPRDLFSCLICYETFGIDQQQQLVALKCGHMFCASCIQQWLTMNKGQSRASGSKRSTPSVLVCPTCRKRCAMKDILHIDISTCIVAYGKKKIDNLSVERDRLKSDIQILQELIDHSRISARQTEHRLRTKRRFLGRLKYAHRQTRRC